MTMATIERTLVEWFTANDAIVSHDTVSGEWVLTTEEREYSLSALAVALASEGRS